jgi:predicted nucleic acid-binding protein
MEILVGDILFVDTNVLLTATDESRPDHLHARKLFAIAGRRGFHLGTSGQILREYLVVATRPAHVNGLGLNTDDALGNAEAFLRRLVFYEETELVATGVRRLTRTHGLTGKRIHDANVVATMLAHDIAKLVTQNPDDFGTFPEVEITTLAEAAWLTAGED